VFDDEDREEEDDDDDEGDKDVGVLPLAACSTLVSLIRSILLLSELRRRLAAVLSSDEMICDTLCDTSISLVRSFSLVGCFAFKSLVVVVVAELDAELAVAESSEMS